MTIIAETLRSYRTSKNLSQAALARLARLSKKTISRIELGEVENPNSVTKNRLAEAPEIKVEEFAKDATGRAQTEHFLKQRGYQPVSFHLDAETAHAFQMIQHRYGISSHTLIKSAPLLMGVLAEGSLQWRRRKASEIEAAVSALSSIANDAAHMAYANAGCRAADALEDELRSIEAADIFGRDIGEEPYKFGYDDSQHNPFASYLRSLCKHIDPAAVELDPHGQREWKTDDCIPDYRIATGKFEALTCGDPWAEFAIERNHVRISDIPVELMDDDHDAERIAWIITKIPHEARRQHQDWLDSLSDINLDFGEAEHD